MSSNRRSPPERCAGCAAARPATSMTQRVLLEEANGTLLALRRESSPRVPPGAATTSNTAAHAAARHDMLQIVFDDVGMLIESVSRLCALAGADLQFGCAGSRALVERRGKGSAFFSASFGRCRFRCQGALRHNVTCSRYSVVKIHENQFIHARRVACRCARVGRPAAACRAHSGRTAAGRCGRRRVHTARSAHSETMFWAVVVPPCARGIMLPQKRPSTKRCALSRPAIRR